MHLSVVSASKSGAICPNCSDMTSSGNAHAVVPAGAGRGAGSAAQCRADRCSANRLTGAPAWPILAGGARHRLRPVHLAGPGFLVHAVYSLALRWQTLLRVEESKPPALAVP